MTHPWPIEAFVSFELGAYEFASLLVGCFGFDTRVAFCSPSGGEPRYLVSVVVRTDRCGVAVWEGGLEFNSESDLVTPEKASKLLSAAAKIRIPEERIALDIENGAPVNQYGSISLVRYIAWMVKVMGRGE